MYPSNRITIITRRNIADSLTLSKLCYHGRLDEPNFLTRLFDLNQLPSKDGRYSNAFDDIHKHTVMNSDWEPDWVFSDNRINLTNCDDETFLKFLCETIHPAVRQNNSEVEQMLELYNKNLEPDGYEIVPGDEISGMPVFAAIQKLAGQGQMAAKKAEIKKHLNTAYVNSKINIMNDAMTRDTDLAIGTSKELLETICKSILKQKGISVDKDWTISKLLKETTSRLDFKPKKSEYPDKAEISIKQVLAGIGTTIQGITELRNAYGSGHGKDANFQGLEPKYAKLIVGVISEVAILYLTTNGETTELIDEVENLPF